MVITYTSTMAPPATTTLIAFALRALFPSPTPRPATLPRRTRRTLYTFAVDEDSIDAFGDRRCDEGIHHDQLLVVRPIGASTRSPDDHTCPLTRLSLSQSSHFSSRPYPTPISKCCASPGPYIAALDGVFILPTLGLDIVVFTLFKDNIDALGAPVDTSGRSHGF